MTFPCGKCGQVTKVTQTRDSRGTIRRRRECTACGERFTTFEVVWTDLTKRFDVEQYGRTKDSS